MAEKWSERLLRTRAQVQTLIAGSGLNYPGFFQISDAVGVTKQVLVWSKSASTINQLALNLTDDTIGIYDITADTFTVSFLTKSNNLSDVADAATANYNIAGIKNLEVSLPFGQIRTLFSSPISLASTFPAVAGKFWAVTGVSIKYTFVSQEFDNDIIIITDTCAEEQCNDGAITSTTASTFTIGRIQALTPTDNLKSNKALILSSHNDDTLGGDGSVTLYITAQLITE